MIVASWASSDSSRKTLGCKETGASAARGGVDIRDASGAVVWIIRETWGFHGAGID